MQADMTKQMVAICNFAKAPNNLSPAVQPAALIAINPQVTNVIYIYIYGAPILDVSRSHTTTQHSR